MAENLNRLPLSKKGQRQVTPFTGNELLYDYMSGILDDERKTAVEVYLENSQEGKVDAQKIQTGIVYAEKLKQIAVSPALQERLGTSSSYLSVLFAKAKIDQWPVGLKWGIEALIVVFVVVTFLMVAPWEKVMKLRLSTGSNNVVLAELNKGMTGKGNGAAAPAEVEAPQFVDEGIKKEIETVAAPAATPSPTPKTAEKVVAVKAVQPAAAESKNTEESAEAAKASVGYLFRGQIAVTNLDAVGPKITDKILELGGRKAGDVELGWQKAPGSAYFHFTIPEAKYEELQAFLSEYGNVKISKDRHPRVMPDGIIRLIITVDEAKK